VLCYGRTGKAVTGFAWINPGPHTRWVVVGQPGYAEAYPVAGRLPVRVQTVSGLELAGRAVFRTVELDGRGTVVARREVVARIAG
jgi:hypothetical protein